jgi:hypothetical protein
VSCYYSQPIPIPLPFLPSHWILFLKLSFSFLCHLFSLFWLLLTNILQYLEEQNNLWFHMFYKFLAIPLLKTQFLESFFSVQIRLLFPVIHWNDFCKGYQWPHPSSLPCSHLLHLSSPSLVSYSLPKYMAV